MRYVHLQGKDDFVVLQPGADFRPPKKFNMGTLQDEVNRRRSEVLVELFRKDRCVVRSEK